MVSPKLTIDPDNRRRAKMAGSARSSARMLCGENETPATLTTPRSAFETEAVSSSRMMSSMSSSAVRGAAPIAGNASTWDESVTALLSAAPLASTSSSVRLRRQRPLALCLELRLEVPDLAGEMRAPLLDLHQPPREQPRDLDAPFVGAAERDHEDAAEDGDANQRGDESDDGSGEEQQSADGAGEDEHVEDLAQKVSHGPTQPLLPP